jgi:hypothetical protein
VFAVGFAAPVHAVAPIQLTSAFTPSHAGPTTLSGFKVVEVTYTNTLTTPQAATIYASIVNQKGQMIAVSYQGTNLTAGSQGTFYFGFPQAPAGSYSVVMFAVSPSWVPISVPSSVPITL